MSVVSPVLTTGVAFGQEAEISTVKAKSEFRNYVDSALQERVATTYLHQHTSMTYEYALDKKTHYGKGVGVEMGIWEAAELLNNIVDESDPDVDTPQIHHCLQTAEAIRKAYPGEEWDWFHLTGFIHDLGKLLLLPQFGGLPQWAVVGDTFPVGCRFDEANVFHDSFKHNPDTKDPRYNTENGAYEPGCGLENIVMSWGHDEYMYQVCKRNNCTLPIQALYMIRFHSFYPWHRHSAYSHLLNNQDIDMLKWVLEFNQFDLYSKDDNPIDIEKLKPYYEKLAKKYFPEKVKF